MAVGCGFWVILGAWFLARRRRPGPDRTSAAACIVLAVVFGMQAIFLGVVAYDQYLQQGVQHYTYQLVITGNASFPETIVVPIPTDESLLSDLRVESGSATWSVVDTAHGRGLYVAFVGSAHLSADFTEFSPSGRTRDDTPTMGNETYGCVRSAFFFLDGPTAVLVSLGIDSCSLSGPAYPGWTEGEFQCCPPIAVECASRN